MSHFKIAFPAICALSLAACAGTAPTSEAQGLLEARQTDRDISAVEFGILDENDDNRLSDAAQAQSGEPGEIDIGT